MVWIHQKTQCNTQRSLSTSQGLVFWHPHTAAIASRVHLVSKFIGLVQFGRNDIVLIRRNIDKSGNVDAEFAAADYCFSCESQSHGIGAEESTIPGELDGDPDGHCYLAGV